LPDKFCRLISRDAAADTQQDIAIEKMCHFLAQAGMIGEEARYHSNAVFDTAPAAQGGAL
jgi:hypothetical protein